MAMTGGAAYLVKSERTNYGSNSWTTDLYIYVKVISQNVVANTSTIALGMYVYSQYSIAWSDFGTNGTSYIGTPVRTASPLPMGKAAAARSGWWRTSRLRYPTTATVR